jgi:trimeric autotransporter adhesin
VITSGDFLGRDMSLSADGNTLAAGAPGHDSLVPNSGAVFVFGRAGGAWSQLALVKAPNAGNNDQFGAAVRLSSEGTSLAVGAVLEDSNAVGVDGDQGDDSRMDSGAVYTFTRGASWLLDRYIKSLAPTEGDQFGNAIGVSGLDQTSAFAALREDSSAIGIDGNADDNSAMDSGAVWVFFRK